MNIKLEDNELSTLIGGDAPSAINVTTGRTVFGYLHSGFTVVPGEGITLSWIGPGDPGAEIVP